MTSSYSLIPDGSQVYAFIKCYDKDHTRLVCSETLYNQSKSTASEQVMTNHKIVTRTDIKEVTTEEEHRLFDIMCQRQEVLELVNRSFEMVKKIDNSNMEHENRWRRNLRIRLDDDLNEYEQLIQLSQTADQTNLLNELKMKVKTLNTLLKNIKTTAAAITSETSQTHIEIVQQLINDIEISHMIVLNAIKDNNYDNNNTLGMIYLNARFDSQLNQRSYNVSNYSIIEDHLSSPMTMPKTPRARRTTTSP
jgi:archaellum component FlaC